MKTLWQDPLLKKVPDIPMYKDLGAFVDELLEGGLDAEMQILGDVSERQP